MPRFLGRTPRGLAYNAGQEGAGFDQSGLINFLLAHLISGRQDQRESAPPDTEAPIDQNPYLSMGFNAPVVPGLSPLGRYTDIGTRRHAAYAQAALESQRQIQEAQQLQQAQSYDADQALKTGAIHSQYGDATANMGDGPAPNPMFDGLQGHEFFQRNANATGPSGGPNLFASPEADSSYASLQAMKEKEHQDALARIPNVRPISAADKARWKRVGESMKDIIPKGLQ